MYKYKLYDLIIETDLDFPQLITCDSIDAVADITIQSGEIPSYILEAEERGKYSDFSENSCWLVNQSIRMLVSNGTTILYSLKEGAKYHRTYLLGWGMSMICLERKTPAIHCSAITDGNKAYLIAGESGSGKSTVTDSLLCKGYQFLADDVIRVSLTEGNIAIAHPCFPYRKLCRDAALRNGYSLDELIYIDEEKDKFLVPSHSLFYNQSVPVAGIIILYSHKGEDLKTDNLTGLHLFHACVGNLFLRRLLKDRKYEPFVAQSCLKIASSIKACTIGRPAGKDTLSKVLFAVETFIENS